MFILIAQRFQENAEEVSPFISWIPLIVLALLLVMFLAFCGKKQNDVMKRYFVYIEDSIAKQDESNRLLTEILEVLKRN
jgi:hypothetical protein